MCNSTLTKQSAIKYHCQIWHRKEKGKEQLCAYTANCDVSANLMQN